MYIHAPCFWQEKFMAEMEIVVKKKSTIRVTVDEQWVSEKEMKDDLGWTPWLGRTFASCVMRLCV